MFGAGTVQWSWGLDGTHDRGSATPSVGDAAGDGEPVRRHGRAAGIAAGGARRRDGVDRRARRPRPTIASPAQRRARSRAARRSRSRGTAADAGGARGGRRGLGRRRRHVAPRHRHDELDLRVDADGAAAPSTIQSRAASTTAATSRRRAPPASNASPSTGPRRRAARARSVPARRSRRRSPGHRRPARSRSASSSGPTIDGFITGAPLLQGRRATPARTSGSLWTATRHAARRRRRSPARPASGWQEVTLAVAGRDHRRTPPTSRRTTADAGYYAGTTRATSPRPWCDGAAARARRRRGRRRTASTTTAPTGVPDVDLPVSQLLGRRGVRHRPSARRDAADRHRARRRRSGATARRRRDASVTRDVQRGDGPPPRVSDGDVRAARSGAARWCPRR